MQKQRKEHRPRRKFPPEFKAEIVGLCRQPGRTISSVANEFDLTQTAVRDWIRQDDIDTGRRGGLTTADRDEITQLRKDLREAREERDILKRATAFFARETR